MSALLYALDAGAVLAALAYGVAALRYMNLWGRSAVVRHGVSRRIDGLVGAEDLALTRDGGLILSCDTREENVGTYANGSIVWLDPDAPHLRVVLWEGRGDVFHPHGLDYFVDKDSREYLFVINHRGSNDTVMIFALTQQRLTLLREIAVPGCTTLNDLTAVSPSQFYVTSDHNSTRVFWNRLSDYLRLPTAYVLYFDGMQLFRAASGIAFANGIVATDGGARLYVASMLRARLLVFERVSPTGRLRRKGHIPLDGSPDNVTLADDGGLVVAVHPKILDLAKQQRDRRFKAPSAVRYLSPAALRGEAPADTLYEDTGAELACASVAVKAGKRLFIGSVYDDHILVCETAARVPATDHTVREEATC